MQFLIVSFVLAALLGDSLAEIRIAVDAPPTRSGGGKSKRATCGVPTSLTSAQQTEMVTAHNNDRAKESASNMIELKWSDDLAARAQQWVSTCTWEHGMTTDCNGNQIGQNMYIASDSAGYPTLSCSGIVQSWNGEKGDWNAGSCASGKVCGHYTQEVWARSSLVGCGCQQCPSVNVGGSTWNNVLLCGCNYSKAGNMDGEQPFLAGAACSNCDSDKSGATFKCVNNLCEAQ